MTQKLTQEEKKALSTAENKVLELTLAYNRTWRKHPTAAGYPVVDKALEKVHEAERELEQVRRDIEQR